MDNTSTALGSYVHYGLLIPANYGICSFYTGDSTPKTVDDKYCNSAKESQLTAPGSQAWMAETQLAQTSYSGYEQVGCSKIYHTSSLAYDSYTGVWGTRHNGVNLLFCDGHVGSKKVEALLSWGSGGNDRLIGLIKF